MHENELARPNVDEYDIDETAYDNSSKCCQYISYNRFHRRNVQPFQADSAC